MVCSCWPCRRACDLRKSYSNVDRYKNDPNQMAGCAFFDVGEIACFGKETVLQPDNRFAIPHSHIEQEHANGTLTIAPTHADCKSRLIASVNNSPKMNGREKKAMLSFLG